MGVGRTSPWSGRSAVCLPQRLAADGLQIAAKAMIERTEEIPSRRERYRP
jgi:hypothetical protein